MADPENVRSDAQHSAAMLFDAFTVPTRASHRARLPHVELIAPAGRAPRTALRSGDWLVERALGEGAIGSIRVLTPRTLVEAQQPRANRIVVRQRKRPALSAWFTPRKVSAALVSTKKTRKARSGASKNREFAEGVSGFLDRPPTGDVEAGRYGLFLRVKPDVAFTAGLDKGEQAVSMLLRSLVGDAYTPELAREMRDSVGLTGTGTLVGVAGEHEIIGSDQGGIGVTSARLGLEVVRWLRDTRHIKVVLDDGKLRRLEDARAVELAWGEVADQTRSAGEGTSSYGISLFPSTHRYFWVTKQLFTDVAWSLGPLVETLRAAMVAFDAKPGKYETPEFKARDRAMGALWDELNRGADAIDAIRVDEALRTHAGFAFLFPELVKPSAKAATTDQTPAPPPPDGHDGRLRFIGLCLARYPELASKAKDRGDKKARRELLDRFTEDFKVILYLNEVHDGGVDYLQSTIAEANASPFPSAMRTNPTGPLLPVGAEVAADMSVAADHWLSLWNYHYWWDLLRIEPDDVIKTSTSRLTMLGRRVDREMGYTATDFRRVQETLKRDLGDPGVGAISMASSLAILRFVGTVVSDLLRAIFEKPYEKSLVMPGPGMYLLRCIAGNPDKDGPLVRVPSAAYTLFFVVPAEQLSQQQADSALQKLREAAMEQPLLILAINSGKLKPDELAQAQQELEASQVELGGDVGSLYALQRKNLEAASAADDLLKKVSSDLEYSRKEIRRRLSDIDRITGERRRRLTEAKGTPYRVIAILVTDLGPTLHMMVEVIDVAVTPQRADVFLIDSTAKQSGYGRASGPTRLVAIRAALAELLENSVTGYGRGWCTILVPRDGKTGVGGHDPDTFRIEKDIPSLMTEMIEGEALIVSILALLAAPFTGGASLLLMIPVGIIGAVPSAYRLARRNAEGTFDWDLDTALDVINILGAFLGLGQAGTGALKLTRLATVFELMGHGANGLGVILGTGEFFDQLEEISHDESLLPGQRRLAMAMAVANQLLNDGLLVGHALAMHTYGEMLRQGMDPKKYPLPDGVLPEGKSLPPVADQTMPGRLKPARAGLREQARAIAGRDVAVVVDPTMKGASAEVRYVLDGYGFIKDVYIALGDGAGEAQIPAHAATAKQMLKFTGLLGKARTLIDWARAFFKRDPSLKVGKTRAWDARLELEKLPAQITDYMRSIVGKDDGTTLPNAATVDTYIRGILDQLAEHEAALQDASPGRGRVAAEDRSSAPRTARESALMEGKQKALAVLAAEPGAMTVRDAPADQRHVSVSRDNAGRIEIRVPDRIEGYRVSAVDIEDAAVDFRDLERRRPTDPSHPSSGRPWTAEDEARYQGYRKAEDGYRWSFAPDGGLRYEGEPPRVWDPARGSFGRDPKAPERPHLPPPNPRYNDAIVPGLYDAFAPDAPLPGLPIPEQDDQTTTATNIKLQLEIKDGNNRRVKVANSYVPERAELSLDVHFIHDDLRTVASTPALREGTTPTGVAATIKQMRMQGIEPGGLRRMICHQIQNVQTVMEVAVALRDLKVKITDPMTPELSQRLQDTAIARYARTIARQSGHVVTGFELDVSERRSGRLGNLMDFYKHDLGKSGYADPVQVQADYNRWLTTTGLGADAVVSTDFHFILHLEDSP